MTEIDSANDAPSTQLLFDSRARAILRRTDPFEVRQAYFWATQVAKHPQFIGKQINPSRLIALTPVVALVREETDHALGFAKCLLRPPSKFRVIMEPWPAMRTTRPVDVDLQTHGKTWFSRNILKLTKDSARDIITGWSGKKNELDEQRRCAYRDFSALNARSDLTVASAEPPGVLVERKREMKQN